MGLIGQAGGLIGGGICVRGIFFLSASDCGATTVRGGVKNACRKQRDYCCGGAPCESRSPFGFGNSHGVDLFSDLLPRLERGCVNFLQSCASGRVQDTRLIWDESAQILAIVASWGAAALRPSTCIILGLAFSRWNRRLWFGTCRGRARRWLGARSRQIPRRNRRRWAA